MFKVNNNDVIDKTKQNLLQLNMLKNMKALRKPH